MRHHETIALHASIMFPVLIKTDVKRKEQFQQTAQNADDTKRGMRSKFLNLIVSSLSRNTATTQQGATPSSSSSSQLLPLIPFPPPGATRPYSASRINHNNYIDKQVSTTNTTSTMITLHHLEHSQSFRILWLLEELQMEYNLKTYKRTKDMLAPEEFKAISPLGTSPTITTADGDALCESNAIMEYILDLASSSSDDHQTKIAQLLRPGPTDPTRRQFLFWFHSSPGSLMPIMTMSTVFGAIPSQVPCVLSPIIRAVSAGVTDSFLKPRLFKILDLAEQHLSSSSSSSSPHSSSFLAGGTVLTVADITMIYGMESASQRFAKDFETKYPNCLAWLDRMRQRPAFQAAQKKVGEEHVAYK
jgi:glutathione S-transferase